MRLIGPPAPAPRFATITQALKHAATTPSELVLLDVHEQACPISFEALLERAQWVAGGLLARGVRPGDRVALILPTGRDFLDGFFGIQLAGAVPVPLYPPVRLGRIDEYLQATAQMLQAVRAVAVISERRITLLLGKAVEQARPPLGCLTATELMEAHSSAALDVASDALGLIQFSSGSTRDPKPVALTHANLVAQTAALEQLMGPDNVGVSWLPLYHDMGLIGCLLSAVYQAGPLVLIPPELILARPSLWLRAISRYRGTISPAPNFAYGLCLKRCRDADLEGVDLSSWRFALNGAEPVALETLTSFAARFAKHGFSARALRPVYGLSESSLAVTFTEPSASPRVERVDQLALASRGEIVAGPRPVVSVGRPVPGVEVEVRSDDEVALGERRVGRVFTRSASVMSGYFENPEATSRALRDGWLDTGDLGFIAGGELFICGRAKELIIIRGANHSPQVFEECLTHLPGIRTGCAVALGFVPPGQNDEQLLILVETTDEPPDDLISQIEATLSERTSVTPAKVVLLRPGTLPRTSSGKMRRLEALHRFEAGTLGAPESINPLALAKHVVGSLVGHAKSRLG